MGPLLLYLLVTFVATWACWATVLTVVPLDTPLGYLLVLLGTVAPSLVALAFTARFEGRAGLRALIDRLFRGQVAARWYGFALGYALAVRLVAAVIHRVAIGAWPRLDETPLYVIPFAIALSTPVQAGEEIGWRGFALPRLAARIGLAWSSVVLGAVWALWHLPLFFVPGSDTFGQSFVVYAVGVVALSVAFAWLWAGTGGSLLLTMLLHAAVNNTRIFPSVNPGAHDVFTLVASPMAWIVAALLCMCAAAFLVWMARTEPRRAGSYGVAAP